MTRRPPRDLIDFAGGSGFAPASCPTCATATGRERRGTCANCGGSGRLWISSHGSLSDEGLRRLRDLLGRAAAAAAGAWK
jgi:hypothetical protein